jgi:putative lipase involved disintegration of autophagic bodies
MSQIWLQVTEESIHFFSESCNVLQLQKKKSSKCDDLRQYPLTHQLSKKLKELIFAYKHSSQFVLQTERINCRFFHENRLFFDALERTGTGISSILEFFLKEPEPAIL